MANSEGGAASLCGWQGGVRLVMAPVCVVGCRSVQINCFFSGLLALISVVGSRARLMACFCILSKISISGASKEVISLLDLNSASPGPETSVTMDSPLWSLRSPPCLHCSLLPRGSLVVHLSAGQGAPGRHARVLCDLRLSSRAGINTFLWKGLQSWY